MDVGFKMTLCLYIYALLCAILLALLEIQIEGDQGWARNLPTWRINIGNFVLTGYHTFIFLLLLLIFHLPFFFTKWTMQNECIILTLFILMWLMEDCMWFFMNRKFAQSGQKDDWRYPKLMCIPVFYFIGMLVALICSYQVSKFFFTSSVALLLILAISFPFQISPCS